MFCENCGMKLEEGAVFCSACGTRNEPEGETAQQAENIEKVEDTVEAEETESAGATQQRFCPNCGCENDENDVFCRECGMSLAIVVQSGERQKAQLNADKKALIRRIVMGAACLAVLVLVIWSVAHLLSGVSSGQSFVIYEKENELNAARKGKFEPNVVGNKLQAYEDEHGNGSGMDLDYYIRYSESGDYLYYPQKCEGGEFDLYRKNLKKKKDTGTKVASKIRAYALINDDDFAYVKDAEKYKLYLYHKGESEKIGSDARWFRISGDGKYILWIADGDLYAQAAKAKAESKKLDSDVVSMYGFSDDLKTIVYQKDTDLYIMKDMKEAERIARDVSGAYVSDLNGGGKIYYLQSGDADLSAAEEAPAAVASASSDDFDPADYASEELTYYDLIADDLLEQDQGIREPEWEDYEMTVYRDGEQEIEMDDAGYEAAYQLYRAKKTRNELRRTLATTPVDLNRWEVFYYEGGKKESSRVCDVHLLPDMSVFGDLMKDEALLFLGDVSMDQMEGYPFSELAEGDSQGAKQKIMNRLRESAKFFCLRNGQVSEVSQTGDNGNCTYVYANEDQHIVYLSYWADDRGILYRYDYKAKGAVPELISDEVNYVVTAGMDKLCYVDEDDVLFYGDREIGEEASSFRLCDDKKLLYLSEEEDSEGTLMLFEGGESSDVIAENVLAGSYGLFDGEHIAYITDYSFRKYKGDMCVFMGKKGEIIDTDVNRIYFPQKEPDRNE